jgi:putative hydrolase of the HAD superfamily
MGAVVFDLFETLITEWGRPKYTTRKIAEDLNIDYKTFRHEWELLHSDRYLGNLSGTKQVYKTILKNLGISRDESLINDISLKRDKCKRSCFEKIEPKIVKMLSAIREMGYKVGLISNCSTEEIEGLWDSDLYRYFDAIVLSCDVGIIKPDNKIYEHCLTLLNEGPSDCFYVGDGGSNELFGAEQTGMRPLKALWFTKHFVEVFDSDKVYPAFLEPSEIISFIKDKSSTISK